MAPKKKDGLFYGWVIVVAGFLITGASVGIMNNTLSIFVKPVTESLGFTRGGFTLYQSLLLVAAMLSMPVYGELFRRGNMKRVMLISASLLVLVPWGYSYSSKLWHFYLLAICHGVFVSGCNIMSVATLVNNWFYEKKGTATGLAVAGSGIAASLMVPVISGVIERFGWQWGYRVMSLSAMGLLLPTILLLVRVRPADMGLVPFGAKTTYAAGEADDMVGFTRAEALRSPSFYLIVSALLSACFAAACMQSHTASYLTDIGHSSAFASSMVSLTMLMLTFGKIGLGWVIDRFGVMTGGLSSAITIGMGAVFMIFAANSAIAPIAVLSLGYGIACGSVAPSQVSSRYFGSRDFSRVYAAISMTISLANIFGPPIPGFIFDVTGSYSIAWKIAAAMTVLSVALFILADGANKKAWAKLISNESAAQQINPSA